MRKIFSYVGIIVFFLLYTEVHPQLVPDFKVNTDLTNYNQTEPKIGVDSLGNFVIAWTDQRRTDAYDVYLQKFDKNSVKIGDNLKINSVTTQSSHPEVAMKPNGNFFICWYDFNGSNNKIRLKYFNSNGDSLSSTINFIDNSVNPAYYKINLFSNGNLIVSWLEYPKKLYFQRFDSSGNKLGNNVLVADTIIPKNSNALCVRSDGSFLIAWDQFSGFGKSVYYLLFDKDGNQIGNRVQVNGNTASEDQYFEPAISSDSLGRFIVAFNYYNLNANSNSVMFQLFNKDGSKKGNNTFFGHFGFNRADPKVTKIKTGEVLLSYFTNIEGIGRTYFSKADTSGNFIGNEFSVSNQLPSSIQYYADFKIINNRIVTTWADDRYGNKDVFGNIRSYSNPDSTVGIYSFSIEIPSDFKLYQNYPNPFNPETNIRFDVKKSGNVSLKIFDMAGKERASLVDENLNFGSYLVKYNFSEFGSGTYFYKLYFNGISVETKKLVLLK